MLRRFRQRSRELQARLRYGDEQAKKETDELLKRLARMGLLQKEATLNDVLALDIEAILGRRLQTVAYMKGLAYTVEQARQFIVHGHIMASGRKVTIPGYLVKKEEEGSIAYNPYSDLANEAHPSRPMIEREALERRKVEMEKEGGKEDEKRGRQRMTGRRGR